MKALFRACLIDGFIRLSAPHCIGGKPDADLVGLHTLHRAHALAIPFENLDVRLGRGISIAPDAVFDKLITRQRGGYCFEHNTLFADVLRAIGFDVRPLLARVWLVAKETPPRTHILNLVRVGDEDWIVDVGFGGYYTPPMRLQAGHEIKGPDGAFHRLNPHSEFGWMLEFETADGFKPAYSFTLDAVARMDIEQCNFWTSTWPESRFIQNVIVSISLPHGVASLTNLGYTRSKSGEKVTSEITSAQMLQMRLSLMFGISLSADELAGLGLFE